MLSDCKKDGYKPAAIIESSPRNFQCVLTIPQSLAASSTDKSPTSLRPCSTRNTATQNYPAQSIRTAPQRLKPQAEAPGRKTARTPYRCFALRFSKFVKGSCGSQKTGAGIYGKNAAEAKTVLRQPSKQARKRPILPIMKNIRGHITVEDFSRVDAMIALRMRANGHSPDAVLAAIQALRSANQDWHGKSGATGQHMPKGQ